MKKTLLILSILLGCTAMAQAEAPQRMVFGEDMDTTTQMSRPRRAPIHRATTDVGVKKIIPRIPVIMVQFADFQFTRTKEQVDSLFNGRNYNESYPHATAKGSIRQYFYDQSMGQYDPVFDIYGPVTVSENCCADFSDYKNVRIMTKEACSLADAQIDFTQYDADNDGQIDLVYIYYAGFGKNDESYIVNGLVPDKNELIWPHWSTTSGASYDGKQIRDYECANELDGYWTKSMSNPYPAGIGVAVHEFCHALGLPDLYSTGSNNGSFKHQGAYDIMDYGPYNDEMFSPPSLSAYERWFLGWLTPTLLASPQSVSLGYIGETNQAYLITTTGLPLRGAHATTNPYYLLENRQKRKWDNGTVLGNDILGHGMMITRVEYNSSAWSSHTVNNTATDQHVKMICADGDYSLGPESIYWYGKTTDLFPCGATEYTEIPSYPITNISEDANGIIHFDFMGGGTPTEIINENENENENQKFVHNGQIYIRKNGKIYTILGHETNL